MFYVTTAFVNISILAAFIVGFAITLAFDECKDRIKAKKLDISPHTLALVLPIMGILIFIICLSLVHVHEQQVFKNAPVVTVKKVSRASNASVMDHTKYTYKIRDTKNKIYEINTDERINFKKYIIKAPDNPHDIFFHCSYSNNIYLFTDNKCVGEYFVTNKYQEKE